MKIKISAWTVITITGLFLHSITANYLRPQFGGDDTFRSELLGIAPNFLAAGFILPFSVLMIREHYAPNRHPLRRFGVSAWFWFALIGSQIALITWEYLQFMGGNLVYDTSDIVATIVGGVVAICIFYFERNKPS